MKCYLASCVSCLNELIDLSYRFFNFDTGQRQARPTDYSRYSNWWRTALWIFWVDAIGFLLILTLNWFLTQTIHASPPSPNSHTLPHHPPRSGGSSNNLLPPTTHLDGSGDGGGGYTAGERGNNGNSKVWLPKNFDVKTDALEKYLGRGQSSTDYQKQRKLQFPTTASPIQTSTYMSTSIPIVNMQNEQHYDARVKYYDERDLSTFDSSKKRNILNNYSNDLHKNTKDPAINKIVERIYNKYGDNVTKISDLLKLREHAMRTPVNSKDLKSLLYYNAGDDIDDNVHISFKGSKWKRGGTRHQQRSRSNDKDFDDASQKFRRNTDESNTKTSFARDSVRWWLD